MKMNAISLEIVNNRLREIVVTMERLLFHSGYSTILRESHDGSACITDRNGGVVMGSGMPIHMFPYFHVVQAVCEAYPITEMRAGDSYIVNDPYQGGSFHLPDIGALTPVFADGEVIGFCASIAHKPDIGGLVAGSSSANSREIFHDGLILPAVRYQTKDGIVKEVDAILRRNSRLPEVTAGDLRAQVGCTQVGAERLSALCAEMGVTVIAHAFGHIQDSSERRMRSCLAALSDSVSEAEAFLDSDGADHVTPVRVKVRVEKSGETITFDLSEMNPQVRGPVNVRPQAAESATLIALLNMLDPTIPLNDGCRRAVKLVNPEGVLSNPRFPATTNNYFPTMHVLYSTTLKALAPFNPQRSVGAAGFGVGGHSIGFASHDGRPAAVQYELFVSSLGATPVADGTPYVQCINHITPYTPIEILESEYPVRVRCFEPIVDSAGAGAHRGGPGYRKEYELLADATYNLRMTGFRSMAWGVFGGLPPNRGRCTVTADGKAVTLEKPFSTFDLKANDLVCVELSGGGGYGRPFDRDAARVREDVANGYVSVQAARDIYGVAVDPRTFALDDTATARLRAEAS